MGDNGGFPLKTDGGVDFNDGLLKTVVVVSNN